jgi:hypothetical protein
MKLLQDELKAALPDPTIPLDWLHLEDLLYVSACIREAVRLSYGVIVWSLIISANRLTEYKRWDIPAGTPVSNDNRRRAARRCDISRFLILYAGALVGQPEDEGRLVA